MLFVVGPSSFVLEGFDCSFANTPAAHPGVRRSLLLGGGESHLMRISVRRLEISA
jgi:hypothetical protein